MHFSLDNILKSILESESIESPKTTINPLTDKTDANVNDAKKRSMRDDGYFRTEAHPAIKKLIAMYGNHNETVFALLNDCIFYRSEEIDTAGVFYDAYEKKYGFVYNPKFINDQIDGFDDLIKAGIAKSEDDEEIDEEYLEFESLQRLNFLIAHEVDHIFKGDLTRVNQWMSKDESKTEEEHHMSNIAQDAVNNQELLDTRFHLGGSIGYKFIEGGWVSTRNEELFKKYGIDAEKQAILGEMSKVQPYDMEENSDTYFRWIMKHKDEYDEYMKKFRPPKDPNEKKGKGKGKGKPQKVNLKVGDPIQIIDSDSYGVITAIDGDSYDYDPISEEEAKRLAKGKLSTNFAVTYRKDNKFESALCDALQIDKSLPKYKNVLAVKLFTTPNIINILKVKGVI